MGNKDTDVTKLTRVVLAMYYGLSLEKARKIGKQYGISNEGDLINLIQESVR